MATDDVPGSNPKNGDSLCMGCWAEHDDGSLIFVESTEADRVIYSMFDLSVDPILEYRHAMATKEFNETFSVKKKSKETWVWHDKTVFPWDRVIKEGAKVGARYASAVALESAANRVAQSLAIKANRLNPDRFSHMSSRKQQKANTLMERLVKLLGPLGD